MGHRIPAFLAAAVFLAASAGAAAQPYSNLYIFGDSLADSGNNAALVDSGMFPPFSPGERTAVPLVPPQIIPTAPYASNRYSNGPVWVEYFAESLGVSAQASLLGGSNFAFGGARSGPGFAPGTPTIAQQAGMFLAATGGVAPASALYVVQGGGNDARDIAGASDPAPLIGAYAANIAGVVGDLQAAGARHFLIANVPDLGKAPAVLLDPEGDPAAASFLAGVMNDALDAALGALPSAPGSRFYRLDLFGLMNELFAAVAATPGGAFGFTDVTTPCALFQACIDSPAGFAFWDGLHPTTQLHEYLGMQAAALVPEPQTYALLLAGLVLLAFGARRRDTLAI